MRLVLPLFFLLFTGVLSTFPSIRLAAQSLAIESLEEKLNNTEDSHLQSDICASLAEKLYSHNFEKGLVYANRALDLANKSSYTKGKAQALTSIGNYYYYNGNNNAALQHFTKAISVLNGQTHPGYPARTYIRLSILYRQQAIFDSARFYLDEAEKLLPTEKTIHVKGSLNASRGLLYHAMSHYDSALRYINISLKVRQALGDSILVSNTYRYFGMVHTGKSSFDSAEYYFQKSELWLAQTLDPETQMLLHLNRGENEFLRGNFQKAISHYTQSLDAVKRNTYKRYYSILLYKIGELYENQGQYHTAYDYLFNALKEFEKINAQQDMVRAYVQIGWCYTYQDNYELAIQNGEKALNLAIKIKDQASIAQSQNLLGFNHYKNKKYNRAMLSFQKAQSISKANNNWWEVTFAMYNMALTLDAMGETDKSYKLLLEAFEIDKRIGKRTGIVFNSNQIAGVLIRQNKQKEAEYYLKIAQTEAMAIPLPPQMLENYKLYIDLYEKKLNSAKTISYYKKYISLKDSLNKSLNSSKISKADALFQLQKKANELAKINRENQGHEQEIKNQKEEISTQKEIILIALSCVLLLVLLIIVILKLFQSNRRAKQLLEKKNALIQAQKKEIMAQTEELSDSNQELSHLNGQLKNKNHEIELQSEKLLESHRALENMNEKLERSVQKRTLELNQAYEELETFFYRTSHDFRRPLTTYLGLVEVANATLKDPIALELFDKIKETTLGLDGMLVKLQSISNYNFKAQKTIVDLNEIINASCAKFAKTIASKRVNLEVSVAIPKINTIPVLFSSAIENIVENAIEFGAERNACIWITSFEEDKHYCVNIKDNGVGIPLAQQDKIFDMYYRANENSKGNGLGLYVTKKALVKLGYSISVESTPKKGSSFIIRIPKPKTK